MDNLLYRLLSELNETFELNKEVPITEEKQMWQFPRFLEAASRHGNVILIVDGFERLRTNDGEGVLRWLPLGTFTFRHGTQSSLSIQR